MSDTTAPSQDAHRSESEATPIAPPPAAPMVAGSAPGDAVAVTTPKPKPVPKMFGIDARFVAPIFITMILLVGQFTFGILESPLMTLLAIAASICTELVLGKLFTGKWPHLASAYISGISVGILVRSPAIWPFLLCAAISITSKYVIRWRGRHLWNPSNFGIVSMLVLAPYAVATLSVQWGNDIRPTILIWIIGSIIIANLKRFHITLTYVAFFIAFAFLRSAITHDTWQAEIAPLTGPMYQLFIFFMITDPKTTVLTKRGQMLVAFLIAAVECVFRLVNHFFPGRLDDLSIHAPYYALFVVGPIANFIEIIRTPVKPVGPPA